MARKGTGLRGVAEILREEARDLSRECELVDWADLAGGVTVVVYRTTSDVDDLGRMVTTRIVVRGGSANGSFVVSTEWPDGS